MLAIIPIMALLTALAGGSIKVGIPEWLKFLPSLLFAVCVNIQAMQHIGYYSIATIAWTYLWFQTGHANALSWGKNADPNRKNFLTPVVEYIYRGGFGRKYSAIFFAVKGFLLSLPLFGVGIISWPLSYDIGAWLENFGFHNKYAHAVSELISGLFLGIVVYILVG